MFGFLRSIFGFFSKKKEMRIGIYGAPNTGKTTLASRICKDITGEETGWSISEVPHETRTVQKKEKVFLEREGKKINMNILDMPGIDTKVDFEDFVRMGINSDDAKTRAKEATKGIVEAIKWLDQVDACLVVFDSTQLNPFNQVNVTLLGNLEAKNIPIILVANKTDLPNANPDRIRDAFPQYKNFVSLSAKEGSLENLYNEIVRKL